MNGVGRSSSAVAAAWDDFRIAMEAEVRELDTQKRELSRQKEAFDKFAKDERRKMSVEWDAHLQEMQEMRAQFDKETKELESMMQFPAGKVTLNVGGVIHGTVLKNLTQVPQSTLGVMFSGRCHDRQRWLRLGCV